MKTYATGALPSPLDLRVFKYAPTADLSTALQLYDGGETWESEYIDDQHAVGICTAISLTMKAHRHFGIKFNADFQYLLQKRFYDNKMPIGWDEGSSAYHAILCGYYYGFLPEEEWTHTTIEDRKGSYSKYIKKLKAIPDEEIDCLLGIAKKYKIKAFASTPVNRDAMAVATLKCDGLLARFVIDETWYTRNMGDKDELYSNGVNKSGHIVNDVRFAGNSRRIVNSWGPDWSKDGTAYYNLAQVRPTEAWSVWFGDVPKEIEDQKNAVTKRQVLSLLQTLLVLSRRLLMLINK